MKLFVSLDVSSFDIKVCLLKNEGDQLDAFTIMNDLLGATQLRDTILDTVQNESFSELQMGLNRPVSIVFIQ